ncbi:PqqC-like protein [bacterium HR08]|nr:PqqC-like protein [bacterium HR08]
MTYDFFGYVLPASVTSVGEAREAIRRMQRAYLEDPTSPSRALFQELQTREEAIFALRQVSLWARNFPRWCANVVQRCPFLEVRQKVIRDMYDEEIGDALGRTPHYLLLCRVLEALGATREQIEATRPLPGVFLVLCTFDQLTRTRHWLVGLQALVAVEHLTKPASAETTVQWWQQRFGLSREQLMFFWVHGPADEEHAGEGMERLLDAYMEQHPHLLNELVEVAGFAIQAYRMRNESIVEAIRASRRGIPLPA